MSWSFGIVNNRLAEVYFDKKKKGIKFIGHCYVDREEFKTKTEQRWIEEDTKNLKLTYRSGKYNKIR